MGEKKIELNLNELDKLKKDELVFYVKLLAGKLEKRTAELEALKAKMLGRVGHGGTKNPYVK